MRSTNENYEARRIPFYFRSGWQHDELSGKISKTNGQGIVWISAQPKQYITCNDVNSRSQSSSFVVAAEKLRRNVQTPENSTIWYNNYFVADHTLRNQKIKFENRQWVSRNICLASRKLQENIAWWKDEEIPHLLSKCDSGKCVLSFWKIKQITFWQTKMYWY